MTKKTDSEAKDQTREEWLHALVEEIRPWYKGELPDTLHVSTGFPSGGSRGKAIGECHNAVLSADGAPHIFVHPKMEESCRVADIMVHELIHAARPDAKHGKDFRELAVAIGLEGKMTATTAGGELRMRLNKIVERIGPYPHAALMPTDKKQSTRLLKCECPDCGYIVRVTAKWVNECGEPFCGQCEDYGGPDPDVPFPVRMVVR